MSNTSAKSFNRGRFAGSSEVSFFAIFSGSADSEGNKFKTFNAIFPKENTSDALLCCPLQLIISGAMWGYDRRYSSCAKIDKSITRLGLEVCRAFPKSMTTGFHSFHVFLGQRFKVFMNDTGVMHVVKGFDDIF